MPTLDENKQLVSDLWLDQPDAHERIDQRWAAGELSGEEAEIARHFVDHGYAALSLELSSDVFAAFDADVDRVWRERPVDLAVGEQRTRTSIRDFEGDRSNRARIPDLHSHSAAAEDLYLNPEIHRVVSLLLGEQPIAIQSLYFELGSEQKLHRDPMFVVTQPASHLIASWTALEDVTAECGPLLYVPGSHRMPWFEFDDDSVVMPPDAPMMSRAGWRDQRMRLIEDMGLEVKELTCGRGDVFIWHAGLLHGGKAVADNALTRRSFVVHYSTAAGYLERSASMRVRSPAGGDKWKVVEGTTTRRIERDGCVGLDAPLRGSRPEAPNPSDGSRAALDRSVLSRLKRRFRGETSR